MANDTGGAAFPESPLRDEHPGMTLLDYFAGQALLSLDQIEASKIAKHCEKDRIVTLAYLSYGIAAAMIAEKRRRESADAN